MTEEAKHPDYLRCLWGEKLQKYSEERWTQTGEPCWNDFQKEQIILPEGLPEKILKHLKSGYCAIIGPENTGKTWLCYGVGFELEKESDVWYVDKGDLKDIEVDEMLNFLEKYIRESEKSSCLIVEDCHRNEEATRRLLMRGRKIENLSVLFTTKKTDKSILKDVSQINLPDDLLTSDEGYAKKIIEKFLEIEGLREYLDIKDLENSAKIGCKDLSQLSECLKEWVKRVRLGGFGKAVKLTDIIKEKEDKKRKKKLSDRAKDVIREIRLEPLDSGLISSASQEKINDFYSGEAPSPGTPSAWGVIAAGAVKRDLEDKMEQVLQENDNFHIICIVAEPGAGKTTLAMKGLYGLSQRGEQAFWLQGRSADFWFKLSELTELINNRLYVFIDNIFRDIDFVEALHGINKGNLPVTIIATSRTNEYRDRNLKEFIKKMELKVSENEKKELLERIGKSYGNLSPDEREVFDKTNLFIVLGMVLSKGKGFSEIIKDIVEKLKVKDEALYRAYEYVCFFSNYDLSIPEDLLKNLDKEGKFYGLIDEKSERGIFARGVFYEDSDPLYPMRFIKAGHQLIAKEALRYYSRYPKVLFEEILEAADEENLVHRRYIAHLIRAILVDGQEISKEDIKDVIIKSEKIDLILQYASISELNGWKLIYKELNLQEEAEKCAEEILLRAPNTTQDCQLLVSEHLNKGLINKAFSTIRDWLDVHSADRMIFLRYHSLVKDKGTKEQIKEVIEETRLWLKDHPEGYAVRGSYLLLVKDKGTKEQIKEVIEETRLWLKEHPEDYTVRVRYLSSVKDKGSKEQIEEVIEESSLWLKDHPEDYMVHVCYLPLVKDKGTKEQIKEVIEETSLWLKDHPEDYTVRGGYLLLVKDKGTKEQIKEVIEETSLWLKDHLEDYHVRAWYLSLVKDKGSKEQIEEVIEESSLWLKDHPDDNNARVSYLTLVKEKGNQEKIEEAIEETTKWLKDHQDDTTVHEAWLVLIRDKGNQEQIRRGIGDTISWLKVHPEDNKIRSVYLSLVRDEGFFEEDIKPTLDDMEQWMKKHGPHHLFKDYLPLIEKIIKTEIDIDLDIELVKQFGYEIIDLWKQEFNTVYIRWIKKFADLLLLMGYPNEYEQIYEMLLKIEINPETKSAIRFSYGRRFLGEAMNPELTNDERIEKLRRAEVTFREVLEIHRGHHMAHAFLAITLKELGMDYEAKYEFNHAEWLAPFDEKRKMRFIGSIPPKLELKNILDNYIIPNEIKDIFEAEGKTLSKNAFVKKKKEIKNRWGIKDSESYYLIIEEKIRSDIAKLSIYGDYHPGRLPYKIGNVYLTFNRYEEAIFWLKIAIREEPENFANWWNSGYAKMKLAFDLEEIRSREETKVPPKNNLPKSTRLMHTGISW